MGEFEDEIAAVPADSEPVEAQAEPSADDAGSPVAEELAAVEPEAEAPEAEELPAAEAELVAEVAPVTDEPAGDVQDQLALETEDAPEAGAADAATPDATADADADADAADDAATADAGDAATADATADADAEPPSDEDLAAAVAASNEQVATEGTLDDIAPGSAQIVPDDEIALDGSVRYGAPWWPFLIYLALWLVFAGVAVWQFEQLPRAAVLYETQQYTMFVLGGLVLAAAGILLIPAVWLGSRYSSKRHRTGLLSSAFVKGALVVLLGVVIWWGTIMALDYLRLGRFI